MYSLQSSQALDPGYILGKAGFFHDILTSKIGFTVLFGSYPRMNRAAPHTVHPGRNTYFRLIFPWI